MQVFEPGQAASVFNEHCRGGYGVWEPGKTCEIHCHEGAIEFFIFLDGQCQFEVEGEVRVLGNGQGVYVGPGQRHKLTAIGDRPLQMFLVVAPNHSPTHTFYKEDGTPVHWDPLPLGTPDPEGKRGTGPSREEINAL